MKPKTQVLRLVAASLLGLLSPFIVSPAFAGDPSGSGGVPSGPPASAGSDDVETIPLVSANPSTGFVIEINSWQLGEFLRGVRGKGAIELRPSRAGKVLVQFTGSFQIPLESRQLRSRSLLVRYHGARDHMRVAQRAGQTVLLQR
jgi:hypothetical protein